MGPNEKGFTFVELLIVLSITLLLGAIVFSYGERGLKNKEIDHYFDQLINDSLYIQTYAVNKKVKTSIEFNVSTHQYTAKNLASNEILFKRAMPVSLKISNSSTVRKIAYNEKGNASYAGRIICEYINGQKEVFVYIGSGRVYIK